MLNVEQTAGTDPIQRNLFRLLFVSVAGVLAPVTIAVAAIAFLWTPQTSVGSVNAGPVGTTTSSTWFSSRKASSI